jgi:hypothetical protein
MKTPMAISAFLVLVLGSSVMAQVSVPAVSAKCATVLTPSGAVAKTKKVASLSHEAGWRAGRTQPDASGGHAATSQDREAFLQKAEKAMIDFMFQRVDTPEMVMVFKDGLKVIAPQEAYTNALNNTIPLTYLPDAAQQGFHYEEVPRVKVKGVGADGMVSATLLLPVSAHRSLANAKIWSKSDTYSIYLEDINGNRLDTLAKDVKSLDYITVQEVKFKLQKGQVVRISYYRSGSDGPRGYEEGRVYEIEWDGN